MKKAELREAQNILLKVIKNKVSYKQSFTKETTAFTKEICFGVCRNFYLLTATAESLVKKKPKDLRQWLGILIGLYQIKFLSTPDYAAVKETVNLFKSPWEKNFVNAILRNYQRKDKEIEQQIANNLEAKYNHPLWFIDKLKQCWPQHWQNILTANNQRPPLSIRVNNTKISSADYLQLLKNADIDAVASNEISSGIIIKKPLQAADLPGFKDGFVSVQDLAAQLAAELLDLQPKQNILDACAAPGGKTCHILEKQPNINKCVSVDVDAQRVQKIQENLTRLNLHAKVLTADCLDTASWWDGKPFDRILLDAPCSATGVMRRHPDIKLLRTAAEIKTISQVQKNLLHKLWQLLAPGGKLVYATCSILTEENSKQIQGFLQTTPNSKEVKIPNFNTNSQFGLQILPGENNMDGFFYCVLQKVSVD